MGNTCRNWMANLANILMSRVSFSAFHRTMTVLNTLLTASNPPDSHFKVSWNRSHRLFHPKWMKKRYRYQETNKGDKQEENMFLGLFRPCVVFPGSGCKSISHTHAGKFEWTIHSTMTFLCVEWLHTGCYVWRHNSRSMAVKKSRTLRNNG